MGVARFGRISPLASINERKKSDDYVAYGRGAHRIEIAAIARTATIVSSIEFGSGVGPVWYGP